MIILDTLGLVYQLVRQASQNRVTIVKSTGGKAVNELFEDCLANTSVSMLYTGHGYYFDG